MVFLTGQRGESEAMLLPFTVGLVVAFIGAGVIYLFYDDILDGIDWLAKANVRKQQRMWDRIVEMKRRQEEEENTYE